jgi:hypothetical protein
LIQDYDYDSCRSRNIIQTSTLTGHCFIPVSWLSPSTLTLDYEMDRGGSESSVIHTLISEIPKCNPLPEPTSPLFGFAGSQAPALFQRPYRPGGPRTSYPHHARTLRHPPGGILQSHWDLTFWYRESNVLLLRNPVYQFFPLIQCLLMCHHLLSSLSRPLDLYPRCFSHLDDILSTPLQTLLALDSPPTLPAPLEDTETRLTRGTSAMLNTTTP